MYEWIPVLMGLCLGGASVLVRRMRPVSIWSGILLIAFSAVLLSGEWRAHPMYFLMDLIEACGGFVAGALSFIAIRHATSFVDR